MLQSLTPPPHPLIARQRALWARYQDISARKGDAAIANCFFPFAWGVLGAKVDNEAMGYDNLGIIDGATPVLDAFTLALDHVERVYPDLPPRG
jgi:hypothetical protein